MISKLRKILGIPYIKCPRCRKYKFNFVKDICTSCSSERAWGELKEHEKEINGMQDSWN